MAELRGSFSGIRDPAFTPGTARRITDPEAEVAGLAFERQVSAGQICADDARCREADWQIAGTHCAMWHVFRRAHDAGHCDRTWAAREASDAI